MSFNEVLKILREEYGEPLTVTEVAIIFGVDRRTIKKYPYLYGGVEIAPGCLRFFEKRIRGIINNANTLQESARNQMARRGQDGRPCSGNQTVRNRAVSQKGSGPMGTGHQKGVGEEEDPFGLAECLGMGQ
jgi:hypothetical protein